MSRAPLIEVHHLSKVYRDGLLGRRTIQALQGVSLEVTPGQIFGLLGPNGAGKTTLIKVLLGIVSKTSGEARLFGKPAGATESRRLVGYLPEHHRFPLHHTARSALQFYGNLSGLSRSESRRRIAGLLERVGLSGWEDTRIRKFSKGMQQRLGLAQAMLHDPMLLILDEPTDGVDPLGRRDMRKVLQSLREEGKTIFINSHLLQEVELVCDHVVIFNQGQLQRSGPLAEFTQATSSEFTFRLQASVQLVQSALAEEKIISIEPVDSHQQCLARVSLADQVAVDRCIDALRRANISILHFSGQQRTLEDAFLESVVQAEVVE